MAHTPPPAVKRLVSSLGSENVAPWVGETDAAAVKRLVSRLGRQRVALGDQATAAIRELAEEQHGVVAWRQLRLLGLTARLIRGRVERGQLVPLHRGVFALGHRRIGRHGEWLAAVLACGPGAVLSYGTAAHLWGIRGSHGPIEVTRMAGHRRPHGIRLHQTRWLPPEHVVVEGAVPVTTLERTVLDCAERLNARQLEHLLVEADRGGRLRWPMLRHLVEQANGRRGRGRLRQVIERVDPRAVDTRSPLEVDFLVMCREAGLPQPQVNALVEGHLVDFAWPQAGVIVETDGYGYHSDRPAFERDHESTVALMATGYKVLRATPRMLERDPGPFLRLVRNYLHG